VSILKDEVIIHIQGKQEGKGDTPMTKGYDAFEEVNYENHPHDFSFLESEGALNRAFGDNDS
jgi:hypothetical protein